MCQKSEHRNKWLSSKLSAEADVLLLHGPVHVDLFMWIQLYVCYKFTLSHSKYDKTNCSIQIIIYLCFKVLDSIWYRTFMCDVRYTAICRASSADSPEAECVGRKKRTDMRAAVTDSISSAVFLLFQLCVCAATDRSPCAPCGSSDSLPGNQWF